MNYICWREIWVHLINHHKCNFTTQIWPINRKHLICATIVGSLIYVMEPHSNHILISEILFLLWIIRCFDGFSQKLYFRQKKVKRKLLTPPKKDHPNLALKIYTEWVLTVYGFIQKRQSGIGNDSVSCNRGKSNILPLKSQYLVKC